MSETSTLSFQSCFQKQKALIDHFKKCTSSDQKYKKIIELGASLPFYPSEYKIPEKIVSGCQSIMYLHVSIENGQLFFLAESEALISKGLAALLISVYNGEAPEVILKCPPFFLDELGIHASLSPSRSNGLASLFLRMKQEALNFLVSHHN